MKRSIELKKERTAKLVAQRGIVDKAKTENREMTPEENASFDALQTEADALGESVTRAETFERNELLLAGNTAIRLDGAGGGDGGEQKEKDAIQKRFSIVRAIRLAHPGQTLDGVEKEVHEMGLAETRAAGVTADTDTGFSLPLSMLQRASQQTVSQDGGAYGGALVQNGAPVIVDNLRPRLFLEDLGASFLTGLTGGDVPLIVASDFAMEFLAEGAAITTQKKTYAGPSLSPKRAGGAVDISNRLLMQSSVDVENMVMIGLKNGFSQLLEGACINGAGGVAPTGLLNYAGILASTTVASASATRALVLELEALIEANDATEKSLGFLMSPKLKSILKNVKTDAGSGIFILQDNLLDGYKIVSTSLMPALNAGVNFPLIYGDFSQMTIGQWGAINIKVNPYSADLSDSVRLTLNTHADMQIANPKAFAKNAFLTA
jgi:HK97 family phage major capsid protein